jgi:hypothetical protein
MLKSVSRFNVYRKMSDSTRFVFRTSAILKFKDFYINKVNDGSQFISVIVIA